MRGTILGVFSIFVACLPLPGCGGGGGDDGGGEIPSAFPVTSIMPVPIIASRQETFTLTGAGFVSDAFPAGSAATVRFVAATGTPFDGGTSPFREVGATVVSDTTITGTTPLDVLSDAVDATVTVVLESGEAGTSASPIAVFAALVVSSATPTTVQSEIPQVCTIFGDGFVSGSGTVNVTFVASGTPFTLGTQPSLTVLGTVINPGTVTCVTPISGLQADLASSIRITLPDGSSGISASPPITFETSTVTSVVPTPISSEVPTLLTVTGMGFAGGTPTVRFRASTGTPFLGGTVDTVVATGVTLVNPTTLTCTSPRFGASSTQQTTVEVALTGGLTATLASPSVTIQAPTLTAIAPTTVPSETPSVLTLTGTGHGSSSGTCNVTFLATSGTPFAGGTAQSITVTGTIVNPTIVTCVSPIFGLSSDHQPDVRITFSTGASTTLLAPSITLDAP